VRINTTFIFVDLELVFLLLQPGWLAGWQVPWHYFHAHPHFANSQIPKVRCLWVLVVIEELGVVGSTP
jgi:hypothetical protein